MVEYKDMYFLPLNKITDIIKELQEIQQQAEEMYITQTDNADKIIE